MEGTRPGVENLRARCVLWHHAGADLSALESRLHQRGIEIAHAGSAYAALAELCASGRPGPPLSLVLVEPGTLGRATEVVRAVARYAPAAVVWAFESGRRPALWPVTDADVAAWGGGLDAEGESDSESDSHAPRADRNGVAPRRRHELRLTADDPLPHPPPTGAPPMPETHEAGGKQGEVRHILTQEELAMLLADEEPGGGPRS